jgi:hyperosmotically inducible protein
MLTAFALPAMAADTGTDPQSFKGEAKSASHKMGQEVNDTSTTTKIKSKLLADKNTSGLAISVTTTNGVVTLSGKVKSDSEKELAEQIARNTAGVADVHNELTVSSNS